MLVLSRKVGESITIDEQITVKVIAIRGNRIRLGFSAPDYCEIRRSEWIEIPEEQGEAGLALASPESTLYSR